MSSPVTFKNCCSYLNCGQFNHFGFTTSLFSVWIILLTNYFSLASHIHRKLPVVSAEMKKIGNTYIGVSFHLLCRLSHLIGEESRMIVIGSNVLFFLDTQLRNHVAFECCWEYRKVLCLRSFFTLLVSKQIKTSCRCCTILQADGREAFQQFIKTYKLLASSFEVILLFVIFNLVSDWLLTFDFFFHLMSYSSTWSNHTVCDQMLILAKAELNWDFSKAKTSCLWYLLRRN